MCTLCYGEVLSAEELMAENTQNSSLMLASLFHTLSFTKATTVTQYLLGAFYNVSPASFSICNHVLTD